MTNTKREPGTSAPETGELQLHRCEVCGTRWLLWPAGVGGTQDATWNLLDKHQRPGSCCDNAAMGEQIEHLRDLPLRACDHPVPEHGEWVFVHEVGEWRCHCGYVSTSWDTFTAHFHAPPLKDIPR
jgi:hypothetical protein